MKCAEKNINSKFKGNEYDDFEFKLAKALILNKIHRELGLDKCRNLYSGAAPISKKTLDFFISIGIPLCEVYGMSEASAHTMGVSYMNKIGSIGSTNELNLSKIIDKDKNEGGELAIYGRHLFMGYLNDMNKTTESFDNEGW